MIWVDLLFAIVFAVVISSLLAWGFGWRHPSGGDAIGGTILFLFLVLLLAMWAAGAWLPPWGPAVYGTSWLALLLIGLFVALLILAIATPPGRRPRSPARAAAEAREEAITATAFGVFFWILILGLLVAALVSYFV